MTEPPDPGGQPQYGQAPYPPVYPPAYGAPAPPPAIPPRASRTARTIVIAGIAAVIVLGALVAVLLVSSGSSDKKVAGHSASTSSSASASSSVAASSRSSSGTAPTESAARAVVERYFADINAKNEADAQTLICADQVSGWKQKIHEADGDFTVTIGKFVFVRSAPGADADTVNLDYSITVTGASDPSTVTFAVVSEHGAKICGEE